MENTFIKAVDTAYAESDLANPFVTFYDYKDNPNLGLNDDYLNNYTDDGMASDQRPLQYPESEEYDFTFRPTVIDMDEECKKDIESGNGFRITQKQKIQQNIKNDEGIFSTRFGRGLQDEAPFADRYRCKCGKLMGKLNNQLKCPYCNTIVKYVGDNFQYFGWLILDNHCYIHPLLFSHIRNFIGPVFEQIISYEEELDQNGNLVTRQHVNQEDSFKNIGIMGFQKRFDEIMNFYMNKHKSKTAAYKFIMDNKKKVFTHCLPVFTLLLRPIKIKDGHFVFEGTNSDYSSICSNAIYLNNISKASTHKNEENILYSIQMKFMHIIDTINKILTGKKGAIRGLYGGRYNYMARCVIIPDKELRVDEVSLPYLCIMELMKEIIINVIQKTFNITYIDAYLRWYDGLLKVDDVILSIIQTLIKRHPCGRGIPVMINRNPTLHYGSIMQMYCVKINTKSYAMGLPLQALNPMNADFDGDAVNGTLIINEGFRKDAERVFNPRNAMFIDRDTGDMNEEVCPDGETIINADNMLYLARDAYTQEEKNKIMQIIERNKKHAQSL